MHAYEEYKKDVENKLTKRWKTKTKQKKQKHDFKSL